MSKVELAPGMRWIRMLAEDVLGDAEKPIAGCAKVSDSWMPSRRSKLHALIEAPGVVEQLPGCRRTSQH